LNIEKTEQTEGRAFYVETTEYGTEDEQFRAPSIKEEVVTPLSK
jgi:hypothetical protein